MSFFVLNVDVIFLNRLIFYKNIFNHFIKRKMFSKFLKPVFNKGLTLNIKRYFDLHEYQSKDVMRRFGVLVQKGDIAITPEQAEQVAKDLNVKDGILILKAQVQAGGRGKGHLTSGLKGGVQILKTPEEVR